MKKVSVAFIIIFLFSFFGSSHGWYDKTHIAVGQVIGFDMAYNLAAPDVAKVKAYHVESYNHWYGCDEDEAITPGLVKGQIQKYNLGIDGEQKGHLYGAIVAAVRAYQDVSGAHEFATYNLAYAGHYIGDLSMPLHNTAWDEFNASHRAFNDGIIENEVLANLDKIKVYPISIKTEEDLIENIVRIASKAKELGYRMKRENRDMTEEEAYGQISDSASLFKAVLEYVGYPEKKGK